MKFIAKKIDAKKLALYLLSPTFFSFEFITINRIYLNRALPQEPTYHFHPDVYTVIPQNKCLRK